MKLQILTRMRLGNEVVAEIPLEDPSYRKWVFVKGAARLHPRNYYGEDPGYLYEATVMGQKRVHDAPEYHEEDRDVLGEYQVYSEEELFKLLDTLVPSTDLFDVPWKVNIPY